MEFPVIEQEKEFPVLPEKKEGDISILVAGIVKAYEAHIQTLKEEISRLRNELATRPITVPRMFPPQKPILRTMTEITRALEEKSRLDNLKVEVRDETK